jgi:hypothetical protein
MRRFDEMQQVLVEHGIPVRDISHYKDSHKQPEIPTPTRGEQPG